MDHFTEFYKEPFLVKQVRLHNKVLRKGVFIIGISLILLIVIGIIAFFMFVIPVFLAVKNDRERKQPRKISYVIVSLLIFHWLFFLLNGYSILSPNIADAMFTPIWLTLCFAGAVTAIWEFKRNKTFAIPVARLTVISLMFSIFSYGISKM